MAFLGEPFTWVNGLGLLVLILGVVLFNWLKYTKLRQELAAEEGGGAGAGTSRGGSPGAGGGVYKLSAEEDEEGGGGSEVEMAGPAHGGHDRGGGGGGGLLDAAAGRGGLRGSGEHAVLMLGVREGFLLDDEAILQASPAASWRRRGASSPTHGLATPRGDHGA